MDKKKYSLLVKQIKWNIYPKDHDIEKKWSLKFWINGKPYKFIKQLNSFNTVKERLQYIETTLKPAAIERLYKEGIQIKGKEKIPHFTELQNALSKRKLTYKKDTVQEYTSKAKQFCIWNSKKQLTAITTNDVRDFMIYLREEKKLKNATINDHISALRTLFKYLIEDRVILHNPFEGADRLKRHSVGFDYFSFDQTAKIRKEINDPFLLLACYFQYYCFIRPVKELLPIQIGDIDTDKAQLLIRGEQAKNSRTHLVPIPKALNEVLINLKLNQYKPSERLFCALMKKNKIAVNYFSSKHQGIISKMGFNTARYKFYSWKHTGAVAFIKAGGTIKELQLRMRHKNIETTDIYLKRLGITDFDVNDIPLPDITQKKILLPSSTSNNKLEGFLQFADHEKLQIALKMGALNIEDTELKFLLQSLAKCLE